MNKLILVLILWCIAGIVHAQRIEPSVIAVSGGHAQTPSVSISWTVGQTAVETRSTGSTALTEGFQQSFLTVIPMKDRGVPFSLQLYPNPARYSVLVSLDGVKEDMRLVLYNLLGEPVLRHEVRTGERMVRLQLTSLPAGLYLLAALSPTGGQTALYKIVKAE
ncbi:MAG: T9SS type A sorting domain-containing protein [Bacteroidia bacterium]|nr:T9SS type A sorting domain-containing protein [Bacteroidia bacterium]